MLKSEMAGNGAGRLIPEAAIQSPLKQADLNPYQRVLYISRGFEPPAPGRPNVGWRTGVEASAGFLHITTQFTRLKPNVTNFCPLMNRSRGFSRFLVHYSAVRPAKVSSPVCRLTNVSSIGLKPRVQFIGRQILAALGFSPAESVQGDISIFASGGSSCAA